MKAFLIGKVKYLLSLHARIPKDGLAEDLSWEMQAVTFVLLCEEKKNQ